jgi:hypothetical protein
MENLLEETAGILPARRRFAREEGIRVRVHRAVRAARPVGDKLRETIKVKRSASSTALSVCSCGRTTSWMEGANKEGQIPWSLPQEHTDKAVELAERLSQCYHYRRRFAREEGIRATSWMEGANKEGQIPWRTFLRRRLASFQRCSLVYPRPP